MLLILDVDGVLTDGTKYYGPTGNVLMKRFADIDFTAQKKFIMEGWSVCWLSADKNVNESIAKDRGIDFHYSRDDDGTIDKVKWYRKLISKYGHPPEKTVYVGDDLFDIPIMQAVDSSGGRSYCPANSAPAVTLYATRLESKGGEGAIMELFNLLYPNSPTAPCH